MLLAHTKSLLQHIPIAQFVELYEHSIIPRLTRRNKAIAISAAVTLSLFYFIREKVLKPPKRLRHIPYYGLYETLKSALTKETYWDESYRAVLPQINSPSSNGIYLKFSPMGWEVRVANPEDAKYIFFKHDKFPKAELFANAGRETLISKFFGGPNIVFLNGEHWKSQRMVANPAFRRSMPVKLFGELTLDLFKTIEESDGLVDFADLMERWTLDAIGRAGFGFNFNAVREKDNDWVNTYNVANSGISQALFSFFPSLDSKKFLWMFPKRQRIHQEMDRFLDMLNQVIYKKREMLDKGYTNNDSLEENEKDLLTLMIESERKGEGILSDEELKSNLCIFFLAGHDTTANSLSFAIYYLAKYPEYQERARKEALEILGDEPEDVLPSVEQTKQMKFINQVIKETLRVSGPAVQVVPRVCTEDTTLSGTFIPKGTHINVDIFNIHHSQKVWNDGSEFNPDRFDEETGEMVNRQAGEGMAWVPFGNGSRQCIGMNFSLAEQRVLLSMLLRKYNWALSNDSIHKERLMYKGFSVLHAYKMDIKFDKRY
ncbi:MAG: cytochrome P450 [Benjaminiella poitrasii]|nr:MAG: cytochrome P450 [Benjaminiella poitrasii]